MMKKQKDIVELQKEKRKQYKISIVINIILTIILIDIMATHKMNIALDDEHFDKLKELQRNIKKNYDDIFEYLLDNEVS